MADIFNKKNYMKKVLTLMYGTGASQVVPILATPILTRMYEPQSFGYFASLMAIVAILSIITTFKYEVSIIQPKNDSDAYQLFWLAISLSVFNSLIVLAIISVLALFSLIEFQSVIILCLIPLSIILTNATVAVNLLLNRLGEYKLMSTNKVLFSLFNAGLAISFGYFISDFKSLFVAYLVSQLLVFCMVMLKVQKRLSRPNADTILKLMREYLVYPKLALPSSVLNTLSARTPVLLLTYFFSAPVAGNYSLVHRILSLPVSVMGRSVGAVYRQEATELHRESGSYDEIFKLTLKRLFTIGVPFFLLIVLAGEYIFEIVFGPSWEMAGQIAQVLSPMLLMKFLCSPLMSSLYIDNNLNINLVGQLIYLLMVLSGIFFGVLVDDEFVSVVGISIAGSIFYFVFILIIYKLSLGSQDR